ncbi:MULTISPECIES: S49 family peptidase [unclassified Neisseria]|uniref:S49 family peptidase n=1 Tax=unclassified Neisseria TaxID=2623750 RepID=UPI00266520F2|nr:MULTISPECIES: S49 family peptidase [unclassified Neisseria]MDO1509862.1 S49 family peptidase [Neisseria sp. MVDL19-042950]MDO1516060.1 S49 family peptidase [Neisseria sp. MVDL18-041461]MDO1563175.1 S49 family peptidase [Neisseria sp. MVDL20-010259]
MQYRIRRDGDNPSNPQTPQQADNWERNTLRDVLLEAYKEQRRGRFWRNLWRAVGVLIFLAVVVNSCSSSDAGNKLNMATRTEDHTAVISLTGIIGGEYEDQTAMLRDSLKAAYENHKVKGIVIRANSPGGSPVVSNTAFNEIRNLKEQYKSRNIPLYVVAEDVCASGCYYIASAADKIYADPSSIVGSIGVIGGGFDLTGLMDKIGVKRRLKTAGSNKGMGDPFSPETPEQTKIWENMLGDIHNEFIKAVKLGRGGRLKDKQYPDVFSGRIYTGNEAKQVGLIDDYGSIYSVARDVVKAPKVVDYTPEDSLSKIFGRRLGTEISSGLQEVSSRIW